MRFFFSLLSKIILTYSSHQIVAKQDLTHKKRRSQVPQGDPTEIRSNKSSPLKVTRAFRYLLMEHFLVFLLSISVVMSRFQKQL